MLTIKTYVLIIIIIEYTMYKYILEFCLDVYINLLASPF